MKKNKNGFKTFNKCLCVISKSDQWRDVGSAGDKAKVNCIKYR